MKIAISSGHGKIIRGASGYIDEVDEARRVVAAVAEYLAAVDVDATVFNDDVSTTQDENLERIVDFHNSKTRDLDVSVHFNAYETTEEAMGCECLYLSQQALAGNVVEAICGASGLKRRGPKKRTDLYVLNNTDEAAILIEVCFVDSRADVDLYEAHFDDICAAICEAISGIAQGHAPKPPEPASEAESRLLGTLEGVPIFTVDKYDALRVVWVANMTVDCDGMPENDYNDPHYQPTTSLTYNSKPINADQVPYVVVPPLIRNGVDKPVMGSQATVVNLTNGLSTPAVVADQGPNEKIGEASCECASRCGLDRNPNYGGTDDNIILYMIWPGVPAKVDGITYSLKA